jgi:2-polyprenyl-3-methyl-5-hydroxy-6-metoxy-1,4-benzoquinol methylase
LHSTRLRAGSSEVLRAPGTVCRSTTYSSWRFLFWGCSLSHIIITRGVKEYRQTIVHYVTKEDIVLEIGCAWGTTSAILYKHAKYVVAIDKGESLVIAKKTYPQIHFEQIDGFNVSQVKKLGFEFNKIYIDISGCRDIYDVLKMITVYEAVYAPEIIVAKSTKLKKLIIRSTVWDNSKTTLK